MSSTGAQVTPNILIFHPSFWTICTLLTFSKKANIFNDYFSDKCKILDNDSTLPETTYETIASLDYTSKKDIVTILKGYVPKRQVGMTVYLSECFNCENATFPLTIFQKCMQTGAFPDS